MKTIAVAIVVSTLCVCDLIANVKNTDDKQGWNACAGLGLIGFLIYLL